MKRTVAAILALGASGIATAAEAPADTGYPIPARYREWVFLTASLDLSYNEPVPGAPPSARSTLDNVFVNPEAYRAYAQTGLWPDGTILVKENRVAASAGSISKSGKYQTSVASLELHVKDEKRFPGAWAFFISDGTMPGRPMPRTASCYACHEAHGAVDTTFVQFYPTLIETAKAKGTLSPAFLKDENQNSSPSRDNTRGEIRRR